MAAGKCSAALMGIRSMMRVWGAASSGIMYADSSAALPVAKRKGAVKLLHICTGNLWVQ